MTNQSKCDGQTKNGNCTRNASVTVPASAFTVEVHFCKTHNKINNREWTATMSAWTR